MRNLPRWLIVILIFLLSAFLILGGVYLINTHQLKDLLHNSSKDIITINSVDSSSQDINSIGKEIYYWEDEYNLGFDLLRVKGEILSPLLENENGSMYFEFAPVNRCLPKNIKIYVNVLQGREKASITLYKGANHTYYEGEGTYELISTLVDKTIIVDLQRLRKDDVRWEKMKDTYTNKVDLVEWMIQTHNESFDEVLKCSPHKNNFFLRRIYEL